MNARSISPGRFAAAFVPLIVVAVNIGCQLPLSRHPLTNEETSVVDDRLLGLWFHEPDDDASGHSQPQFQMAVGRQRPRADSLETVMFEISDDRVTVKRMPLYVAEIAGKRYLSWKMADEDYLICRYELKNVADDFHEARLFLLDRHEMGRAIERGDLAGTATRDERSRNLDDLDSIRYKQMRIEAEPADLMKFLEREGDRCFEKEPIIFYRRQ